MADNHVNKAEICRRHGWTRYQFDQLVAAGMPYLAAPADKGGEWRLSSRAVERWVRARRERAAAEKRRQQERYAAWWAETERQAAVKREAEALRLRQEREAVLRAREAEERRREDEQREKARQDAYSACFRLAMVAYGVTTGLGWPQRPENQKFLAAWPNGAMGGPPEWWCPPPGMLEFALNERRRDRRYDDPEPDWARFLGNYKFGEPWPWRESV